MKALKVGQMVSKRGKGTKAQSKHHNKKQGNLVAQKQAKVLKGHVKTII